MKKTTLTFLFIIQAVALLVMTCGRNGPLPPPDKTPPGVVSTSPADGASLDNGNAAPINTPIMITFSKEMDPASINAQTVLVSTVSGSNVGGRVSAVGTVANFKPDALLAQNTQYAITVNGTVKDIYGIPMGSTYVSYFWTEPLPSVVTYQPIAGASDVATSSTINVVFSEPVEASSVTLTLISAASGTVLCTTDQGCLSTLDNTSFTYTPTPLTPLPDGLAGNTTYTVIIKGGAGGVTDSRGKLMEGDVTWSFTTGAARDITPPVVSATTPTNGSSNVSVATGITVTFSEVLTEMTKTVLLNGGTGPQITCELNSEESPTGINQTVAMFGPVFPPNVYRLEYYTLYTATLLNGGVFDLSTNQMSANYSWTFTTERATTSTNIDASDVEFGLPGIVLVTVNANDETAGDPAGTVQLYVDANPQPYQQQLISSPVLTSASTATFTIYGLGVGDHALVATYAAQGMFSGSTGTGILTVYPGTGTTTSLQASVTNPAFNSPVTFTATVTPTTATGTVWFIDLNSTTTPTLNLPAGTLLSTGNPNTATFTTSALTVGAHSIIARYVGDANFPGGSQSTPVTVTVGNASTNPPTLTQSSGTTAYSASVTFTASVTSSAGTPTTGTVTFSDGATTLGTVTLSGSNVASYATTSLAGGQHTITAIYNGNGSSFGQSPPSIAVVHYVTGQPTTTGVTTSANPSLFNGQVTFTATVASNPAGGTPSGTVTFSDNGVAIPGGTGVSLVGGTAAFSTSSLAVGPHSITAVFNPGNTYFATSTSATLSQTVNRATTTTNLTSSTGGQPVTPGATVTFTAALNPGTATGTVTFMDGIASMGTVTLNLGAANFSTANLSAGTHTITAVYNGDTNYAISTSNTVTQAVTNASVTISVVSSLPTSTYGNSVTFTATVSPVSGGGAVPTGTVTFKDGSATLGNGTLNGGSPDRALFTTLTLATGGHSITAVYNGDATYSGGQQSSPITQTVIGTTITSVVSSAPTSTYGNSVTFTATVTGTGGIPAGTVSFYDGAVLLGTGTLNGGSPDQAVFNTSTISPLNAGTHTSITAVYSGNTYFTASPSPAISQTVNPAPTTMTINAPGVPYGAHGIVYVTVSSGILLPTGNVYLSVDGGTELIGALGAVTAGVAQFDVGILTFGNHTLSARYPAQGNFGASSATGTLSVGQTSTSTTVQSSLNPSGYGDSVTFTAAVTGTGGTPTGTVTFKDGVTSMGTVTLNLGMASFPTTSLSAGTHNITATYNGDANFGTSTSPTLQQFVTKASSATTLQSSLNPSVYTNSVTFTATVNQATATGTVTFKDGSTAIGSVTLSGGVASFSTSTLSTTSHAISAVYSGDTNYAASTSDPILQTVNKAVLTVTANNASRVYAASNPTFTVTYSGFVNGDTQAVLSGTPSLTTTAIASSPVGPYTITASQGTLGATNYSFSFVNGTLTVTQAVLTVTADNPPSRVYGAANPVFTVTYSGFVNGDTQAVLTGAPSLTTTANATSPVGNYPITAAQGTLAATNYSFSFVSGTLSVIQASTTTAVTSSANPAGPGNITFTATVTPVAPSGSGSAATGNVNFYDGGTTLIGSGTLSGGQAQFSTPSLTGGGVVHSITAVYYGDANYSTSTSDPYLQTVN